MAQPQRPARRRLPTRRRRDPYLARGLDRQLLEQMLEQARAEHSKETGQKLRSISWKDHPSGEDFARVALYVAIEQLEMWCEKVRSVHQEFLSNHHGIAETKRHLEFFFNWRLVPEIRREEKRIYRWLGALIHRIRQVNGGEVFDHVGEVIPVTFDQAFHAAIRKPAAVDPTSNKPFQEQIHQRCRSIIATWNRKTEIAVRKLKLTASTAAAGDVGKTNAVQIPAVQSPKISLSDQVTLKTETATADAISGSQVPVDKVGKTVDEIAARHGYRGKDKKAVFIAVSCRKSRIRACRKIAAMLDRADYTPTKSSHNRASEWAKKDPRGFSSHLYRLRKKADNAKYVVNGVKMADSIPPDYHKSYLKSPSTPRTAFHG